ncbi:hypothetical protein [Methylobacterium frigidaeris]|uniref:Uncharacterized protein n=1 Tax=Methylobacterium frigidaeris TaxID=2038277 RepID=A0AA37HEX6_9HYPH|nr:hypothetical protein [Methylobacterium frigidaeris]PIK73842.1 hypothetical protein CS379_06050 [Methylobacterium frigidaeris]GJD64499.1 hypothetical protein MPEAHAMD_4682 [Methylobacterium frigidaeris]
MTWLDTLGSAGFGLVSAWLALHVAHGRRHRLRSTAFAAALLAGGLVLAHEAGSPVALVAGSAVGAAARLGLARGWRAGGGQAS